MLEQYSLIQKGDIVELTHNGASLKFEVLKVQGEVVALAWTHENVVQLKWVAKAALLTQLYAPKPEIAVKS